MSWSQSQQPDSGRVGQEPDRPDDPIKALLGVGFVIAICAVVTSFLPGALALLVLEGLLFWASLGYMTKAFIRGDRWSRDRLNSWDQALLVLAASIAVGLFVDPSALEALAVQSAGTPS